MNKFIKEKKNIHGNAKKPLQFDVWKFKGTEEESGDESFQETSLQAICESCDSSKKQAIRIPEGQMEKITDLGIPVAETVRIAVAEYLRNLEPMPPSMPPRNALPSNLEKHLVIREKDNVLVKVIYMDWHTILLLSTIF